MTGNPLCGGAAFTGDDVSMMPLPSLVTWRVLLSLVRARFPLAVRLFTVWNLAQLFVARARLTLAV